MKKAAIIFFGLMSNLSLLGLIIIGSWKLTEGIIGIFHAGHPWGASALACTVTALVGWGFYYLLNNEAQGGS